MATALLNEYEEMPELIKDERMREYPNMGISEGKLYCDCLTCRGWDGECGLIQTCHKITCVCGDNVNECTRVWENGNIKYLAQYKRYRIHESCGFNIDPQNKKLCASYVGIVERAKDFLYWITREMCACKQETRLSLQRVTAGALPSDSKQRTIRLENELQLFYVCNRADDEREDIAWLQLPRKAKHVCGEPGILKYRLNKNEQGGGELVYECRRSNACCEVEKDILFPAIYNGDERL
ncbi:Hypothetical predicted protein [Paramuricea clavata]|uniref:Uncharacterized protein n=1 Tax=Paramuricea clavata TaxID=317549 RepID=A0A7D9DI66_PARCT|nr:Hypothetical predicted protein [Paramuricea clavata]